MIRRESLYLSSNSGVLLPYKPRYVRQNVLPVRQFGVEASAGRVGFYEPSKRIRIDILPQVEKVYDLTQKKCVYSIGPDIEVGTNVTVKETKSHDGTKQVTIRRWR
jgi:hypothetical protein